MSFDDWVAVICAVGLTGFGVYCVWQTSDWEIERRLRKSRQAKIHQDLDQLRPENPQYWSRLLDLNDTENEVRCGFKPGGKRACY